jgi:uncharacterized protein (DUF111 family)
MRVLYVDVVGGAAGDMLLAALLDAGASPDEASDAVSAVLGAVSGARPPRCAGRVAGARARSRGRSTERRRPRELLTRSNAPRSTRGARPGQVVLERMFDAEAKVHGRAIDEFELEELGERTLLDVVGVAAALESSASNASTSRRSRCRRPRTRGRTGRPRR